MQADRREPWERWWSREVIYSIQLLYMSIMALKVPLVPHGSKHRGSVYAEVLGTRL